MKCPFCEYSDTKVVDTRAMEDRSVVRRRRVCEECGERFTTYERIDTLPLVVIKADATRESFDKNKIIKGIVRSCNKRPVKLEQIEMLVQDIENTILNSMKKEVESKQIGEMVIERLKDLDEVAYVRFASVYRKFTDIDSFMKELSVLLTEKEKKTGDE